MAFINGRFLTSSITFWLLTFFFPFSWDNFRYLNYVRKASMSPVSKFFRFVVIELSADILYYFITILITPLVMSHISFPLQILPLSSPLIRLLFLALQISLDFQYSSVVEENVISEVWIAIIVCYYKTFVTMNNKKFYCYLESSNVAQSEGLLLFSDQNSVPRWGPIRGREERWGTNCI